MATRLSFRETTAEAFQWTSRKTEFLENTRIVDDNRPNHDNVTLSTRASDTAGTFQGAATFPLNGISAGKYVVVAWQVNGVWTYAYFGVVTSVTQGGSPPKTSINTVTGFVGAILPPVDTICRIGYMEPNPFLLNILQDKIRFYAGMKEAIGPTSVCVARTPVDKATALFIPIDGADDAQMMESVADLSARNPLFISGDTLYASNLTLAPATVQAVSMYNGLLFTPDDYVITLDVGVSRESNLLWQDDAMTIQANADGHLVRRAICPTTGKVFRSPDDASRPFLRNIGNVWWLQATGTQFLDMNPTAPSSVYGTTTVLAWTSASVTGLFSTAYDGAGEDANTCAVRAGTTYLDIWPGSVQQTITPRGGGQQDILTVSVFGSGGINNMTSWFNGVPSVATPGATSGSRVPGTRTPCVMTAGSGTPARLTGYIRKAAFFKRLLTETERLAIEYWAKS